MDLNKPTMDQCRPSRPQFVPTIERCLFIGGPDDGKFLDVPITNGWAETAEQKYVMNAVGWPQRIEGRYMRLDIQLSHFPSCRAGVFIFTGISPEDAFKMLLENYMSPMRRAKGDVCQRISGNPTYNELTPTENKFLPPPSPDAPAITV